MSWNTINYGSLTEPERDANGNAYFGAGNDGTKGWHGRTYTYEPSAMDKYLAWVNGEPAPTPYLSDTVFGKVIYRQGEDAAPDTLGGQSYHVDGGTQQAGVHGAPVDHDGRASWNVHYSFYDHDGDFTGAWIDVDLNPTAKKDFLRFNWNEEADGFVAIDKNGNMRFLDDGHGNGAEPGDTAADSINMLFFQDLIDQDGQASNGFTPWNLESGQFDFRFGQAVETGWSNPFNNVIQTDLTVFVGEAAEPPAPLASSLSYFGLEA